MRSREVVYHGIYSPKDLKSAVKQHLYPPAINCVVIYNSPPDCSRGAKMNKIIIKGTKMDEIPFPFKVYKVKSKFCQFCNVSSTQCRPVKALSTAFEPLLDEDYLQSACL